MEGLTSLGTFPFWVCDPKVGALYRQKIRAIFDRFLPRKVVDLLFAYTLPNRPFRPQTMVFKGHTDWVKCCAFSPDGRLLVSGSKDCTLRVWDLDTGKCVKVLRRHKAWVVGCAVSYSNQKRLVASTSYKSIRLWNLTTGQCIRRFRGHKDWVDSATFSPDGSVLVTCSRDNTLLCWDVTRGVALGILEGHTDWVRNCVFPPVVPSTPRGTRATRKSATRRTSRRGSNNSRRRTSEPGEQSPDEEDDDEIDDPIVFSCGRDRTLRKWRLGTGEQLAKLHAGSSWDVCAFSGDGTLVASAALGGPTSAKREGEGAHAEEDENFVRLWALTRPGAPEIAKLPEAANWVDCVAVANGGAFLATAQESGAVRVRSLTHNTTVQLKGHNARVEDCQFSPDARTLVSASRDHTLRLWIVF